MILFSALSVTYNQEKYVREMIDSVMNQSILPYEFIISDDCSSDNTWNIILEYQQKYPTIIKAFRQEKNVGYYKNLNFALSKVTGDILCALGGDDFFEKELFFKLTEVIIKENIDVKNESFIIVTNTAHYYPNGKITIWNNYRLKGRNIFQEQLRGGVSLRWIGYSTKLLPYMYAPVDMNFGADWYRNSLLYYHCPKYYFANFVSTYYRVGVGITSKLKLKDFAMHSKSVIPFFLEHHKDKLTKSDIRYLKYAKAVDDYLLNPSLGGYLKALYLFLLNINNFSPNNNFWKQLKKLLPFKNILYKVRKWLYGY
ncbi:MAG: glycosyltransferase family 2 protein [Bacteroidales bacterium]|nr:glycosyltransferase family 2 protein [Bacteroidales bacterium]